MYRISFDTSRTGYFRPHSHPSPPRWPAFQHREAVTAFLEKRQPVFNQ